MKALHSLLLVATVLFLGGCERHYFQSKGAIASSGGDLAHWSRPLQGCSPDPIDGRPIGQSSTLFTLYWDNPVERDVLHVRRIRPPNNLLEQLEVSRQNGHLLGLMKTARLDQDVVLDASDCSTFKVTTTSDRPVIAGGRPTIDGTLDLDCQVAGSHVTAAVTFSGCEY